MNAKLLAITSHPTMSPEELIAYAARVSSPHNQDKHDTSAKLLKYCLRHGHLSVFEQVDMTLEIRTTRGIMAQILRHWSARFQEFSQRYATVAAEFPPIEIRLKHEGGNRQGSAGTSEEMTMEAQELIAEAAHNYESLIERGAAPESARFVLPLATPTTAYMKASVRTWITYFWQRLDHHAQKEHRELAEEMFAIFRDQFPVIAKLVEEGKTVYVERARIEHAISALHASRLIHPHANDHAINYLRELIE